MSVRLIQVPKRVTKHEETANIRKVSNGYKVSNPARTILGINPGQSAYLAIGRDEITQKLVVKSVPSTAEYNAVMNKNRVITSKGISRYLQDIGNQFTISKETNSDGYHFLNIDGTTSETSESNTSTQTSNIESHLNNTDDVSHRDTEIEADNDDEVTFG